MQQEKQGIIKRRHFEQDLLRNDLQESISSQKNDLKIYRYVQHLLAIFVADERKVMSRFS